MFGRRSFVAAVAVLELCSLAAAVTLADKAEGDEAFASPPQGRGLLTGGSMDLRSDASRPIVVESDAAAKTGSSATSAILMEDGASSNVFLAAGSGEAKNASSVTFWLLSFTACCSNCCCLGLIYWVMKKMMNRILQKKKEWDNKDDAGALPR